MLPFDLLNLILSYLPVDKFFDFCQHSICLDKRIWANRLYQDFGIITEGDPYLDYVNLVQEQAQQQQHQLSFDKERVTQQIRKNCDAEIDRVRQQYSKRAEMALDLVAKVDENKLLRMVQSKRLPELTIAITAPVLRSTNPNYNQRNRRMEEVMRNLGVPASDVNYYSPNLGGVIVETDYKTYNLILNSVLTNRYKYKSVNVLYNY